MNEVNQEHRDRKYNEWARRNPAIVSIVFPLLVVVYFFQEYTAQLDNVRYIVGVVISFGSIVPALLFFYQSSIREISVLLVEKPLFFLFGRPSINMMRKCGWILSEQRKERIIKKANAEGIDAIYTDGNTPKGYFARRKMVREAFERIREKCRDNAILFDFHCTYGFFRNLSGGLIVDLLFCWELCILDTKLVLGIGDIVNICSMIIATLFLFCLVCTYYAAIRYAKRVYVIYDN